VDIGPTPSFSAVHVAGTTASFLASGGDAQISKTMSSYRHHADKIFNMTRNLDHTVFQSLLFTMQYEKQNKK